LLDNRKNVLYNNCMDLWWDACNQSEGISIKKLKIDSPRNILDEVRALAVREDCSESQIILYLLDQALRLHRLNKQTHQRWISLSLREKQVAALICSGLTDRQIAARFVISPETVKTHVRHILRKFLLHSRQNLRDLLLEREIFEPGWFE